MAAPKGVTLQFTESKETPGTFMFMEDVKDGDKEVVGRLYIKKAAADLVGLPDGKVGRKLTVTIKAASS